MCPLKVSSCFPTIEQQHCHCSWIRPGCPHIWPHYWPGQSTGKAKLLEQKNFKFSGQPRGAASYSVQRWQRQDRPQGEGSQQRFPSQILAVFLGGELEHFLVQVFLSAWSPRVLQLHLEGSGLETKSSKWTGSTLLVSPQTRCSSPFPFNVMLLFNRCMTC